MPSELRDGGNTLAKEAILSIASFAIEKNQWTVAWWKGKDSSGKSMPLLNNFFSWCKSKLSWSIWLYIISVGNNADYINNPEKLDDFMPWSSQTQSIYKNVNQMIIISLQLTFLYALFYLALTF